MTKDIFTAKGLKNFVTNIAQTLVPQKNNTLDSNDDDINIPDDLIPFMPNGPLYIQRSSRKQILLEPGSKKWSAEMRRLKKCHEE
ncbi:hypothetical protein RhiirA4_453898 [Rhizophagus irregularis]|uniref:Uncharacterized protein n=1 Tax=Rhizophagus irregularis TaxID=588596 RepID=A0A2I1G1K4_9GLOM|nr:hypothetical protein RhiirA4_453898 [Rhizophagus irregularis]